MADTEVKMGDKILLTIYELENKRKAGEKITKKEMVVKVWKRFHDYTILGDF